MRPVTLASLLVATAVVFGPSTLFPQVVQTAPPPPPTTGVQVVAARRAVAGAIRLDGHLDEAAWRSADSIAGFRQREPLEGEAASLRTVVRLLRDDETLFIGVSAYDPELRAIRATQLRRDADLTVDDNVTLLVDSFHDRRTAFLFRTNPNGAMWDAQLTGSENTNADWNGIWDVAVSRDSSGWTAEFRIPLRTLRFRPGQPTIGFNVQRYIQRRNEETLWRSFGRKQGLRNLAYAGEVTGFADVAQGRRVEVRPYALAEVVEPSHDLEGVRTAGSSGSTKGGVDAKSALTPTLTADLTLNTDFAQVEADHQVINLTRFPTFFPEKREFFLESSGLFDFGTSSRTQAFYSRRIGLRNGVAVPILAGARVYGKVGGWAIGAIDARTGGDDDANDAVVRVRRDVLARSYVGGIATVRSVPGQRIAERTAGVDIDLPLIVGEQNIEPAFWIMGTRNDSVPGTPLAWRVSTDFPNDLFDNFASLYRIDGGFDPSLGFVSRSGIYETTGHLNYLPRPGILGIRRLDIELPSWDVISGRTGSLGDPNDWQTAKFSIRPLGGEFQSGDEFEVNVLRYMDAPADTFEVFDGVSIAPGRYWWTRTDMAVSTNSGRPVSIDASIGVGDFYDGRSTDVEASVAWRGGGHLILRGSFERSAVSLPSGHFTAASVTGRVEYAFNTRADLLAFVQHNNEDRRVDFNVRFHWIPAIGDDFFVVWNSGYTTDPTARYRFPSRRVLGRPLNGALVVKAVKRFAP